MIRKPSPEKRAQYLRAALKLFVANGVQNTSTAAIAKQAGTAAGTLFLYFPTKQDLINELVMDIVRAQSETIKAALTPALSVQRFLFSNLGSIDPLVSGQYGCLSIYPTSQRFGHDLGRSRAAIQRLF